MGARGDVRARTREGPTRSSLLLEREEELARLGERLERAGGGEGSLVCIEGEAGIGKTALLDRLSDRAWASEATVLRARGGELERDFPYGVARQLFEPLLRDEERRQVLLDGAAKLAAAPLGLTDPAGGLVGVEAAMATSHGLYWLTANLAAERPVVLLVDDLHWVDDATLIWLHYLGPRLDGVAVLAALAWRPAEPGTAHGLQDALRSLPGAERLSPAPLSPAGTEAVIAKALGRPSDAFVGACYEATGGNPFLLSELLRALPEQVEPDDEGALEVGRVGPRSISRSVLGTLATMSPEAVALARAVAVLDSDAELAHASALAEIDPTDAAIAADALTDAHVFAPGRPLRFAHPILRRAVYEDLPHGRRAIEHGRAAAVLEAAGEADRGAVHLMATEPTGDASVCERLRAAAHRAFGRGAPAGALALLRRALDEPPPAGARGAVLLELGRAARLAGDADAARYLREALERASGPDDRVEAARELALALSAAGDMAGAASVLEQTADELPAKAREGRLELEAELLATSIYDDRLAPRAIERIDRLLPRLRGGSPAERLLLAGAAYERVATGTATGAEVADLVERALTDLLIAGEHPLACAYLVMCLLFTERDERAEELLDAMSATARRTGSMPAFGAASTMRARFALVRGDLVGAEGQARGALDLLPKTLALGTEATLAFLVFALVEQGRLDDAERLLSDYDVAEGPLPRQTTSANPLLLARSALRLERGLVAEARDDAEQVLRRQEARGGLPPASGFRWSPALALQAGGGDEAGRQLAERELKIARAFGVPSVEGIALAMLGVVLGGSQGRRRLEEAVAKLEATPRRLDHAHALVHLGAALRRANRRSDARAPLRLGMDLAHRCGARPLAERARQELLACGARPRRLVLSGVESLTASERRVAQMAAEGMSNPEIAQALFVTRKTVEAHLSQAYGKLEIGSRAELAEALRAGA